MTPYLSVAKSKADFEDFLFASVGEEANGMTLSVLSALSRLEFDPWDEAVRLSQLPKDRAVAALAQSIACLPRGVWQLSDTGDIAIRLVALLPNSLNRVSVRSPVPQAGGGRRETIALWLVAAAIALSLTLGLPAQFGRMFVADDIVAPIVTPTSQPSPRP